MRKTESMAILTTREKINIIRIAEIKSVSINTQKHNKSFSNKSVQVKETKNNPIKLTIH